VGCFLLYYLIQPLVGTLRHANFLAFAITAMLAAAEPLLSGRRMNNTSCANGNHGKPLSWRNKAGFSRAAAINMLLTPVRLGWKLCSDSIGRIERIPPVCRDT
jgi:hypothetical protein